MVESIPNVRVVEAREMRGSDVKARMKSTRDYGKRGANSPSCVS